MIDLTNSELIGLKKVEKKCNRIVLNSASLWKDFLDIFLHRYDIKHDI